MIDLSAPQYDRSNFTDTGSRQTAVVVVSVVLHVLVLVGLPLLSAWFTKPKTFERPHTFQLVSAPVPPAPARRVPTPPEPAPAPDPTPPPPDPVPTPAPQPKPPEPTPKPTPTQKPVEKPKPAPPKEEKVVKEVEDKLDDDLAALLSAVVPSVQASSPGVNNPYVRGVQEKIKRNYRSTKKSSTLFVEVSFTISYDGSVSNLRVNKSSGDPQIDRDALNAVERSVPFAKLPHGLGDRIEINCTLRPTEG